MNEIKTALIKFVHLNSLNSKLQKKLNAMRVRLPISLHNTWSADRAWRGLVIQQRKNKKKLDLF